MSDESILMEEQKQELEMTPETENLPESIEQKNSYEQKALYAVPMEIIISVGKAYPKLGELAAFSRDTLLQLENKISDPVEILVSGKVIARGELQEMDDGGSLGVRITQMVHEQ